MSTNRQFETPMMRQYLDLKRRYPDCMLFFRMGDFYEMFLEDAEVGADILDITLTSRTKGKDGRIPMAGVPYHAAEGYLSKLVSAGKKVAIAEQVSDPKEPGLVKREVVRIVTPGTRMEGESLLDHGANYVVALRKGKKSWGWAAAELSTGEFGATEISIVNGDQEVINEITKLQPREVLLCAEDYNNNEVLGKLRLMSGVNVSLYSGWKEATRRSEERVLEQARTSNLEVLGLMDKPLGVEAAAALLGYLEYTQQGKVEHLRAVHEYGGGRRMKLDRSTILNLELFSTLRSGERKGSLFDLMNKAHTAMGMRMLREWLVAPLVDREGIEARLDGVEWLVSKPETRDKKQETRDENLQITNYNVETSTAKKASAGKRVYGVSNSTVRVRELLKEVSDVERLVARLATGLGNGRDVVGLRESVRRTLEVRKVLMESGKWRMGNGEMQSKQEAVDRKQENYQITNNNSQKNTEQQQQDSTDLLTYATATASKRDYGASNKVSGESDGISRSFLARDDSSLPEILRNVVEGIDLGLQKLVKYLDRWMVDEPPVDVRSGKMIRDGVNEELDALREIRGGGTDWLRQKEIRERERTGIGNLRIKFNKVFGFYIEVSKGQAHLVPEDYERKQTLVNAERYITPDLKEYEERVLTAEERIGDLEYRLFVEVVERTLKDMEGLQRMARAIAGLDCLASFAELAVRQGYVRPVMLRGETRDERRETRRDLGEQQGASSKELGASRNTELQSKQNTVTSRQENYQVTNYNFQENTKQQQQDSTTLSAYAEASSDKRDYRASSKTVAEQVSNTTPTTASGIEIIEGRHPVVEEILGRGKFISNDVILDDNMGNLWLVTGPNMAGKSVLIRQTAVICLMAQMGSFVPASKATLPVLDGIYVRSGANDALTEGLSTFMVEMIETAYILRNATERSLIVMDEIGRGTSTFDGISLAWAIAEWLVNKPETGDKRRETREQQDLNKMQEASSKELVVSRNTEQQENLQIINYNFRKNTEQQQQGSTALPAYAEASSGKRDYRASDNLEVQGNTTDPAAVNSVAQSETRNQKLETNLGPWVLFATHYHELQELAELYPNVRNVQVAVERDDKELVFLHKVIDGGASHSYGVQVAKLAGVPEEVVERAEEVLRKLEGSTFAKAAADKGSEKGEGDLRKDKEARSKELGASRNTKPLETTSVVQLGFGVAEEHEVVKRLRELKVEELTPLEALNLLAEWKERV